MKKSDETTENTIQIEEPIDENKDQQIIESRNQNTSLKNGENELSNTNSNDAIPQNLDQQEDSRPPSSVFGVPKRYILAILMFCGFMNMYAIRVNLNVAIGAMVKNHTVYQNGKHISKVNVVFVV